MSDRPVCIGTRDSRLAVWQAEYVADSLQRLGVRTRLQFVKTEGDRVLDTPLPLMGGKGVFTRALDEALLRGDIDIAVHSLKDIPTTVPEGLVMGAISTREQPHDVLVPGEQHASRTPEEMEVFFATKGRQAIIASSSNRRIGQWLSRFPHHRMVDIRGNIQTRLGKLASSSWDGAIFAAAGLTRLGMENRRYIPLHWMVPAPGQGALGIMIRSDEGHLEALLQTIHDERTAECVLAEREVLHRLQGGCSAPIGVHAFPAGEHIKMKVHVVYPDGTGAIHFVLEEPRNRVHLLAERAASQAFEMGADKLVQVLTGKPGSSAST